MKVNVGQVLSRTLAVVVERFGALLGLWAVFFAAQIIISVLPLFLIGGAGAAGLAAGDPTALGAGMILGLIVFYVVYFLIYFAQIAALISMASPLHRLSFGDSLNAGFRSAPTMLIVVILLVIVYLIGGLIFGLIAGILASASSVIGTILAILLLPVLIYLFCRLSMVNSVIAVERVGNPITAISRGWSIAGGNVLTIFLSFLVFGLVALLAIVALVVPFYSSITSSVTTGGMPNFGAFGLMFVGLIIFGVLFAIIGSALFAVLHAEAAGESGANTSEVFA